MLESNKNIFYVTYSTSKTVATFLFLSLISILMLFFGIAGCIWLFLEFAQIEDPWVILFGGIISTVVSCCLIYTMYKMGKDMSKGKPLAIISRQGVELRMYSGWKKYPWSEILYGAEDRNRTFKIVMKKSNKHVQRQSVLKSIVQLIVGKNIGISTMLAQQSCKEVENAFNKFNPNKEFNS